jgi:hypothetical protein
MNTSQALKASLRIVPDTLEITIGKQREQLADQLRIADSARRQEDLELWATAACNARDVARALDENLEMQTMSRATVKEADTPRLIDELRLRAKEGDKEALAVLKPKKEAGRGSR